LCPCTGFPFFFSFFFLFIVSHQYFFPLLTTLTKPFGAMHLNWSPDHYGALGNSAVFHTNPNAVPTCRPSKFLLSSLPPSLRRSVSVFFARLVLPKAKSTPHTNSCSAIFFFFCDSLLTRVCLLNLPLSLFFFCFLCILYFCPTLSSNAEIETVPYFYARTGKRACKQLSSPCRCAKDRFLLPPDPSAPLIDQTFLPFPPPPDSSLFFFYVLGVTTRIGFS